MGEQTIGILPVLVTQVALQAVLALILAGILGAFYRLYRHAYLRHWSLSWLALVVYIGASAVSGLASGGGGHPWRVPAVLVSLVAGYLQVAWLLLGAWGLAEGGGRARPYGAARAGGGRRRGPGLGAARSRRHRPRPPRSDCGAWWPESPTWRRRRPSWLADGRSRAWAAPSPGSPSFSTPPISWPTSR